MGSVIRVFGRALVAARRLAPYVLPFLLLICWADYASAGWEPRPPSNRSKEFAQGKYNDVVQPTDNVEYGWCKVAFECEAFPDDRYPDELRAGRFYKAYFRLNKINNDYPDLHHTSDVDFGYLEAGPGRNLTGC